MIIVVLGLPGSGKSYFAKHLADRLNAHHIKSDEVRAELQKMGTYDSRTKEMVYEAMIEKMESLYNTETPVILDATFYKKHIRKMVQKHAHKLNAELYFIRITASEDVIHKRVSRDRPDSEADYQVYLQVKEAFEPLETSYVELDSSEGNIGTMLDTAEEYLAS